MKLLVRFANETVYRDMIEIDPERIVDPMVFKREVFFTIDGVRVSVHREDWDKLQLQLQQNS